MDLFDSFVADVDAGHDAIAPDMSMDDHYAEWVLNNAGSTTASMGTPMRLSELAAADDDGIVVIDNQEVILDSATVEGILVHGENARLFADDTETVDVTANWILVHAGAVLEVGSEDDLFENDLTITLRTDDMGRDVDIAALLGHDGGMGHGEEMHGGMGHGDDMHGGMGHGDDMHGGMGHDDGMHAAMGHDDGMHAAMGHDMTPTMNAMDGGMDGMDDHMHMMEITDNDGFLMAMGEGSRIELHAADAQKESWSQLTQTVERGDTVLHLDEATGWEVGDEIALAPTGSRPEEYEEYTIKEVRDDGREIVIDGFIKVTHFGEIVSYDNGAEGEDFLSWDVDLRGEVALLSRNVTIQGDEESIFDGLGAHTMIMMGAEQHVQGVEYTRVGQVDILGRYPVHWHMLGDTDGQDQYLRNVSIHDSFQKIAKIQGTNDVTIDDIVGFKHIGHGIFFEDGSENDNLVQDSLIFGTRASATGEPIPTDRLTPASFWIENPNNTFIGNHAAGSEGQGFRIAPAIIPHGESREVFPFAGGTMDQLVFIGNTAHSSRDGVFIEGKVNPGTLQVNRDTVDLGEFTLEDTTVHHTSRSAIWIKGNGGTVDNAMVLDAGEPVFFEQTNVLKDSLIVGLSDNPSFGNDGNPDFFKGIRLYRDAPSGLDGVHFVNFDASQDAIRVRTSDEQATPSWGRNLTFENTPDENRFTFVTREGVAPAPTNRFVDIDGSLTGVEGGILTPVNDALVTTDDALYDPTLDAWISPDTTPAVSSLFVREGIATTGDLTITRSDGAVMNDPQTARANTYQFALAASATVDYVYTLEFDSMPSAMQFETTGLREGDSLTYKMEASADFRLSPGSDTPVVDDYESLMASDVSALYHDGTDLYVRLVGGPIDEDVSPLLAPFTSTEQIRIGDLT
ncbi:MAG: G8 domain-containing protein [Pseudomonadota bacterium]